MKYLNVSELSYLIKSTIHSSLNDADVLAEKVKRATYLIKFYKTNLRTTEKEVNKVLSKIEEKPEAKEFSVEKDEPVKPF